MAEFVREVNSKAWDQARWAEVIPQRGTKLTTDQSLKIIGEMYDVMKSNICIDILARFLEQRHILNTEQSNFFVSQAAHDPDHETRKFTQFVILLKKIATIPTAGCVKSLYLSLLDSYERERQYSTRTEGHMIIAGYLRKQVQVVLNIRDDDDSSQIERCINDLPEHAVTFELAKASTLAQNLGIAGLDGSNNFWSYKEVCKLWLNNNSGDQCTLGQLVCALFKSGLARLCCGLRPIYDSNCNQSRFKSFIHESVKSQSQFKRMVKFFGYEHEGRCIERKFKGMINTQARLLLRLLLIPNCGDDDIEDVIKCLDDCLEMSESQLDSEDQPSVACEQPSETEAKVVSYSHVTKDLSHDHDGSTALTLVDKAQGPTKVSNPDCSPGKASSTGKHGHLVQGPVKVLREDDDLNNQRALLKECIDGEWQFVRVILETEEDGDHLRKSLAEEDFEGKTPLHYACLREQIDCVKLMIEKLTDISHVDKSGNSVLHYPSVLKNKALLLVLLEECAQKKVSINKATKGDYLTPLMVACTIAEPDSITASQLLLAHDAAPDGHSRAHSRPIIVACEGGNLKLMKLLVSYAADINVQDGEGNTALLKACCGNRWNIVKYLLGLEDVSVNKSDKSGTTPLFAAVSANNREITEMLLQKEDIRVNSTRIQSNTNFSEREQFGGHVEETPLAHACARGFLDIVELLLNANADVNFMCSGSVPPIGFAIICRQNHVVSYLLTHPKLDKSFSRLSSAIVISVKVGNQVCTNLLLDLFGGVERSLELAEQNYLPEVQQHIHEFMLLPEIERDAPKKQPQLTEQRAKLDEVMHQFCQICIGVITKRMPLSQWAELTKPLDADMSSFFRRLASGNERQELLKADFLGSGRGQSPLSFLVIQEAITIDDFLNDANTLFDNEPESFYETLIEAFHTIPGGESLPWNIRDSLERVFSSSFSLSCERTSSRREYLRGVQSKALFQEAMENGYVLLNTIVLLLIGIAGAGKTSFCHMLFGERPPTVRKSTPLALSSIRAMSFCRAAVSQMENTSIVWQRVSPSKLNSLITDGIKAFRDLKSGTVSSRALTGEQPLVAHSRSDELSTERSPVSPSDLDDADTSRSLTSVVHTSSSVRTSPLSDIDQLFELDEVKELLQLVSQSKGSFEIFRKEWLYISDTGGQPKFHELLPTFVRHVSAVAFFIKLNEKFSSRPMIAYYSREGASICEPYQSSQTNLEVIQNCLQAMQTRCIVEGSTKCPELFFVGTHRDLENVYEPLESKNAQLLKLLRQDHVFAKHLAYYSLGKTDQLIFPVNSKEPSTEDEKVVERFRQSIMEKCHKHQRKIPLKWFVLESLLQKLADDGVISYEKCLDVANRLGMDEPRLKAALEYLVQLNIFEFFPHVLSKVVFTTSQVLLTKMTELIEYAHILLNIDLSHSACTSEDQEFRDHGYISEKFLKQKRFSSHYISGLFEAKDLLKLLENRLVVSKQSKDIYIMTAALPELSSEKVDDHHMTVSQMSTHVPIAVHYPSCLFPIGIFTSLVSHLQTKSSWKILMNEDTGKPEYFYKNCIDFVIDTAEVSANVTLIYTHQWIELHTCIYGEKSQAHVLVRMLFDGLKHAAEVQKYSHIVPKLAFLCPGEKGTSQISAKCKHAFPHLASITPNDFLQCTHNKRIRYKITDDYRHWTESPTDKRINDPSNSGVASTVTVNSSPSECVQMKSNASTVSEIMTRQLKVNDLPQVYRSVFNARTKWYDIGLELNIDAETLNCIVKENPHQLQDCLRNMLKTWLERAYPTPTWGTLIEALKSPLVDREDLISNFPSN